MKKVFDSTGTSGIVAFESVQRELDDEENSFACQMPPHFLGRAEHVA